MADETTANSETTRTTRLELTHAAREYLGARAMKEGRTASDIAAQVAKDASKEVV
jgi:hypothetical protein